MSTPVTLGEFTDVTLKVVQDDGIADYLPTLALADTKRIQAIEGIPAHVAHTEAIQNVIARSGFESREFFFGVRSGEGQITTGHYRPGKETVFMLIRETPEGYSVESLESCIWWTVGLQQNAPPNGGPGKRSGNSGPWEGGRHR
jgi:hypothetical protein